MPYHFGSKQLRVVERFSKQDRNSPVLKSCRMLLVEHVLPTVEEFVDILVSEGVEVHTFFAKPYSIDRKCLRRLLAKGLKVEEHSYAQLEQESIIEIAILDAIQKSKVDKKKILFLDVGGYFCAPIQKLAQKVDLVSACAGVIEDTTFGHNRYEPVASSFPLPIFSVARSALKEIEARYVGRDAVISVEHVLRDQGVLLSGRDALVIGYGMIGKNVARALKSFDLNVSVYDKHDHKNLEAFVDGFNVHKKKFLLQRADIIFSATADRALSYEEIEDCKDLVVLASVGSKDTEFDVATLKRQSPKSKKVGNHIIEYNLHNSKCIRVVKHGTAVNFLLPSLPVEVLDLVFAEIFLAAMLLLKRGERHPPGRLYSVANPYLNEIARDWLRIINQ